MSKAELKQQEAREALAMEDPMTEEEEIDYITGFLKAAEMLEETIKKIRIERKGQLLFTFKIHALSEDDMMRARKMATTYMPNPINRKLPKVEKDFNKPLANSCLIYLATTDEDKKRLWDNPKLKEKLGVVGMGYDLIDKVLTPGEKAGVIEQIDELCGYTDDEGEELSDIDIAKN